ncbi:aspartic proteinase nepenthesin-2 [Carex littledalei]|uniref:nepenthesin n=1 Tax=Carex littledalei TaxID=544730 RepID=A0A833VWJ7_9POAL|nr:aspartic proteinase nepenthesin-2 [Carex littledalei]
MVRTKVLRNILSIITLVLLASLSHAKSSKSSIDGLRIHVRHIDSKGNFSKMELLQRMTHRSHKRMNRLVRKTHHPPRHSTKHESSAETNVHVGSGEYVMDIAIGTPSLTFPAIIDTGSDLIWTQCKPCGRCFSQPTPIFDPSTSSTYKRLPCTAELCKALPYYKCGLNNASCQYQYVYGDGSFTHGNLSSETFTLGSKKFNNIAFGCGNLNSDGFAESSGLVGLGRSKYSLVSQLKFKAFSYCFASLDKQKQSPMLFGSLCYLNASVAKGPAQTTPLLKNPIFPFYYYLSLLGITVGTTKLDIPSSTFALNSNGTGGMLIDSGTSITYLEQTGYDAVKRHFISQMRLPVADGKDIGFDLCFASRSKPSFALPKFILHFDGADLALPENNYFIHDSDTGLFCLTVMGSSGGMSILGSMQQENFKIIYDTKKSKLSFIPTQCDQQ